MLYREPKLLKGWRVFGRAVGDGVSVLYREPKLLKAKCQFSVNNPPRAVSVLYREPKLLKDLPPDADRAGVSRFSALP